MGIWQDADFRLLPPPAQHLYFLLWTDPSLSYCGVLDWRPGRIAAKSAGWSVDDVNEAAACLRARHFLVVDEVTEECLIRSWVRWDELMKQPRIAVSYTMAYGAVASNLIRGVLVDELHKLRERTPNLPGLSVPRVLDLFDQPRISAKDSVTVPDPFGDGFPHRFGHRFGQPLGETPPKVSVPVSVPPTPSPAPTPTSKDKRVREASRFPEFWAAYPNKKGKAAAQRVYEGLVRRGEDQQKIIDGAAAYAKFVTGVELSKVKYPQGWLSDGRWEDDYSEAAAENEGGRTAGPFTPPLPPGDMPDQFYRAWNIAHAAAYREGRPGPTDWRELQAAS